MRVFIIFILAYALVLASVSYAMGAEREFDVYCADIGAAAVYAEALSDNDAASLNTILDMEMCGFFSDHFGGNPARGEIMDTKVLGTTGYVAEYIRFPNGIKTITVVREGA